MDDTPYLIIPYDEESLRFKSIADFKTCMMQGGEVVIQWKGWEYGIWSEDDRVHITSSDNLDINEYFETADDALNFSLRGDRLRDIITKVKVIDRTI